ncbi:hypothetical protein ACG3QT_19355 [Pseudomonas paraeruginosa]
MSRIEVAVLVGTSVPESLRSKGLLACWILLVDGAMWAGPFASRDEAEALKGTWELELAAGGGDLRLRSFPCLVGKPAERGLSVACGDA